ncbi:MAG: 3-hydroxyacyl-ACP dehydratase FabZ [Coriobacteriia bacterium]|nr:3-hydroxyacyl-ACP dehydratase FabZ [Coriobacteriia bacterium]
MLDRSQIQTIIPHRDPMLLVDRILEFEPGVYAIGELDVTTSAFWVPGHFPDYAVMPGVLIVEALAQAGAVALLSLPENAGKIGFFAGIDKVRFKKQVVPGDVVRLECRITKMRGSIGFGEAKALVDGALACSGELMFAIQ